MILFFISMQQLRFILIIFFEQEMKIMIIYKNKQYLYSNNHIQYINIPFKIIREHKGTIFWGSTYLETTKNTRFVFIVKRRFIGIILTYILFRAFTKLSVLGLSNNKPHFP